MRIGIRLLFAIFLINGIAAFLVLRVFMAEIKPSVREVMEDMMVDTANILAKLASLSSALLGAATLNTRTVLGGALILLASLLAALQFRQPGAAGPH